MCTGIYSRGSSVVRNLILIIFRITSFPFHTIKSPPRVAYFLARREIANAVGVTPHRRDIAWKGLTLAFFFFHIIYYLNTFRDDLKKKK